MTLDYAIRSRLEERLVSCLPAASFEMETLCRLAGIVESREIETAAVECRRRPRLLVNPDFVADYCARDEHLFLLVMHELWHVILAHTRLYPRVTLAHNVAFDAVINAGLARQFPGMEYRGFLERLNPADSFPGCLLRPPEGWPSASVLPACGPPGTDDIVARLYPHPACEQREMPTYQELLDLLAERGRRRCSRRAVPARRPLRRAGRDRRPRRRAVRGDSTADRRRLAAAAVPARRPRQRRRGARLGDPARDTLRRREGRFRAAAAARARPPPRNPRAPQARPRRDRRRPRRAAQRRRPAAAVEGGARTPRHPLGADHQHARHGCPSGPQPRTSTSTCPARCRNSSRSCACSSRPYVASGEARAFQFSTELTPVGAAALRRGELETTFGTDIRCVFDHLLGDPHVRRALLLTDGYTGAPGDDQRRLLEERRIAVHLVLPAESAYRNDLEPVARSVTVLPPLKERSTR